MGEERKKRPEGTESRKIHKTHFSVPDEKLKTGKFDSGYVWVNAGNGRQKRVLKQEIIKNS